MNRLEGPEKYIIVMEKGEKEKGEKKKMRKKEKKKMKLKIIKGSCSLLYILTYLMYI